MALPSSLTDGTWQDRAFVTVIRKSDQKSVDLHGATDEFGFGDGTKDFDTTRISNGGDIRERTAESAATVNATLYQVGAKTDLFESFDRPRGVEEFFYESGDQNSGKTSVSEFTNTLRREDYLYVVMWTDDPSVESATDSVGEDYHAYRRVSDNINWIDATPDFSDEVLTLELEGKRAAFNPAGKPNQLIQEKYPETGEQLFEIGINADGDFEKTDDSGTAVEVTYF